MTPTLTTSPPVLTIRQTYLRWILSQCPRGARALLDGIEGPHYGGAARGTAVHEFFARYNEWLSTGTRMTDWTQAERILADVLAVHPGLTIDEREDVTEQARGICASYMLDRQRYYGSEEHLECELELADGRAVTITGTLDLLLVDSEEGTATVRDAKSNHQLPADSAVQRDLQLTIYAMLVMENLPHVDVVKGELWFTRYSKLLPRKDEALWTREDIETFKGHLRGILAAFLDAETHEAIPGSHCQYCPLRRPGKCVLWRSYYGVTPPPILTDIAFRKRGRQIIVLEERLKVLKERAKDWVKEHGPAAIGSGEYAEVFAFRTPEHEEIGAADLLAVLEENRSLVGEQPLDTLLSARRDSKAFKDLRYHRDLKGRFDDVARTVTGYSTFGHKKPEGGEDE